MTSDRIEPKLDQALSELSSLRADVATLRVQHTHTVDRDVDLRAWVDDHESRIRGTENAMRSLVFITNEIKAIREATDGLHALDRRIHALESEQTSEVLTKLEQRIDAVQQQQTRWVGALTVVLALLSVFAPKLLGVLGI